VMIAMIKTARRVRRMLSIRAGLRVRLLYRSAF
jgi:hypothetical protein